jgi:DNA-binding NarL/FixJ family response regulator
VPVRAFLVDGQQLVREGIQSLLEADGSITVVGEASSTSEAFSRVPLVKPDVAVLDVQLGDESGVFACRELRTIMPDLTCLMLASAPDDEALYASVMAGASGFLLKDIRGVELVEAILRVATGASLLDALTIARVVKRVGSRPVVDAKVSRLSRQERRILDLIAQGRTNRQIGQEMYLAEKTVKNYVTNLLSKLKMSSRTEAAVYATKLQERELRALESTS